MCIFTYSCWFLSRDTMPHRPHRKSLPAYLAMPRIVLVSMVVVVVRRIKTNGDASAGAHRKRKRERKKIKYYVTARTGLEMGEMNSAIVLS